MSTNTIESAETNDFLLTYSHGNEHCILRNDDPDDQNKRSLFAWDCKGTTGKLKRVLRCDPRHCLEEVSMTCNGNVWTGSYSEAGQKFTLRISNFTHDEEKIAGDIQRCHPEDGGIGGDDMGSFTGTKTRRLTAPAAR
jgi:hypothetical protein